MEATTSTRRNACDFMVLLPTTKQASKLQSRLIIKEIMDRLVSTGFTHVALTHTIYGRPKPTEDRVNMAIPESLWMEAIVTNASTTATVAKSNGKACNEPARKRNKTTPPIKVLRRLHVVLENLSDVGAYVVSSSSTAPSSIGEPSFADLIREYDMVSISPRNETVFQSICKSTMVADIITLDYTAGRGGLRLPYKIRPIDIKSLVERQVTVEIPFAPALLNNKQRKGLVQTCRELQMASLGIKPNVLFSSGDRTFEDADVGAMAFRTPGDLSNLMQSVLGFDAAVSQKALGESAIAVLTRAGKRRFGNDAVTEVYFDVDDEDEDEHDVKVPSVEGKTKEQILDSTLLDKSTPSKKEKVEADEDNIEDGFISMT